MKYCPSGTTPSDRNCKVAFACRLRGNARVLWQYKGSGGQIWGVPSPDGRYLAILGTVTNSNVWMLEGF
jgi:hypothetical protein